MSEASHVQNRRLTSPPSLLPASPPQPCPSSCPGHKLGSGLWFLSLCDSSHLPHRQAPQVLPSKTDPDLEVLSTVTATSQVQAPPPLRWTVATASLLVSLHHHPNPLSTAVSLSTQTQYGSLKTNVRYSTIYNTRTRKQPSCPLKDEWIKKTGYIYTVE